MNKAILIGYIGSDPSIKYFDNGGSQASFSFATSKKFTNRSGEKVTSTQWHRIVASGKLAELVEKHMKKGMQLAIEGEITYREWEKDGKKNHITEIVAGNFEFTGSKSSSEGENKPAAKEKPEPKPQNETSDGADDLPF